MQLAAFQGAIASCDTADEVSQWLTGDVPDGIDVDLSLRWRLLVQLAALGGTDRAALDRLLAEEPTATSRVDHARAVASLPDDAAKAWAWSRFTGAEDVPNYELQATGQGMWVPGQEHLTTPYVERFFADLPSTPSHRSGWVLADAACWFFPLTSRDPGTVRLADRLAGDESLDLSLRRQLRVMADELAAPPRGAGGARMTTRARARRPGPSVRTRVTEHLADGTRHHEDRLATEEPLEIRLAVGALPARRVWVTMRTPGHDFELAAGFAMSESLCAPGAIRQVAYCTDAELGPEQEFNVVTITVAAGTDIAAAHRHEARSAGSSACGVCGKDSVAEVLDVVHGARWTGEVPSPAVARGAPGPAAPGPAALRAHRRRARGRSGVRRRASSRSSARTWAATTPSTR